ncbi:alpha/beta fold hydrolase [Caulobacter mirabilis]|uniref:Alpha/beta hydrolase n=1 Tax=Caulobacter mirabilis TaxID=69666 RepID=A0A2D2B046_9CAUL|nr:alpha/beta hydrolase [Caulobacter mirabilis]ATQ43611.1 alpha/beta hydrolase [Caulobacter mirabilis]
MISKRRFLTASLAAAPAALGLASTSAAAEPPPTPQASQTPPPPSPRDLARGVIRDARKIVRKDGIEELRPIVLGGVTQWISVRGRDRRNPILLFIHGGPGSTEMPGSWLYQSAWEDYFTVVQWDQRAAGKSAASNDQAAVVPTVTVERMTADGEELVAHLRRHYGKRKIFVLGHSWGTVIGMNLAVRRPEWLHAYIGSGQMIHMQAAERIGYDFALREAKADGHETAVRELEAIAPYPKPDGSLTFNDIVTQRNWVIHYGGLTAGRSDFAYEINARRISPDYTDADLKAGADNGVNLVRLLPELEKLDYRPVTKLDCPVFMFLGRRDYQTPSQIPAEWLERVKAPAKKAVWFEHSAHMSHIEQPGRFLLKLVQDVRPIAVKAGDAAPDDAPGL